MRKLANFWKVPHEAGEHAQALGNALEAERYFLSALRAAKNFRIRDRRRHRSLEGLADVYLSLGKERLAESVYRAVIEGVEAAYGPAHPKLAEHLEHMALFFMPERFEAARAHLKRSQQIRQRAWGASSPDLALCDVSEAFLYAQHGKWTEAELYYKRAVHRIEKGRGDRHPDLVFYLQLLAGFYRAQRRFAEAEPLYRRVLSLVESQRGWGEEVLVSALEDLGRVYRYQEKHAEAEELFQRITEICEQYADRLFST